MLVSTRMLEYTHSLILHAHGTPAYSTLLSIASHDQTGLGPTYYIVLNLYCLALKWYIELRVGITSYLRTIHCIDPHGYIVSICLS